MSWNPWSFFLILDYFSRVYFVGVLLVVIWSYTLIFRIVVGLRVLQARSDQMAAVRLREWSVPGIVFLAGFHSLSPTFPLNASQNRVCPVSSTSIAALASLLFTKDLRLGCFIFIRGRISRDNMRTVPRGKLTRFAREVTRAPSVSSSLIWRQVTAQTQPQRRVLFRGVVLSCKPAS